VGPSICRLRAGGGAIAALVFAKLTYSPGASCTSGTPWTVTSSTNVANISGVTYQQPAFVEDGHENIWLADYEITATTNNIVVYERGPHDTDPWNVTPVTIYNPNSGEGANGYEHAPRPVYLPTVAGTLGNIGLLYQSYNCLYWVTITDSTTPGYQVSYPPEELSTFSNDMLGCNLVSLQEQDQDTASSNATDRLTGNQYLGFVSNAASGGTNVYALVYDATAGTWGNGTPLTSALYYPYDAVYVKSTFVTAGGSFYSYMFVNDKNQLGLFESAALPASISYMLAGHLSHIPPGTNQSYADPRIEAPQYINTSHISFAPVWEQYKYGAYISPSMPTQQSLIFWNNIPN